MTIKVFKAEVAKRGGTIEAEEPYNTNNDWGFGGMMGTRFTAKMDDMVLFFDYGQLCYRHLSPKHEDHIHVEKPTNHPCEPKWFFKQFDKGARTQADFKNLYETERNSEGT